MPLKAWISQNLVSMRPYILHLPCRSVAHSENARLGILRAFLSARTSDRPWLGVRVRSIRAGAVVRSRKQLYGDGGDMLLDHRTYTVRVGTLKKQLALYEKHGLAVQKRYFGEPLAWLISETGDVNSYVHIWMYEDAADRTRKRTALFNDPDCLAYLEKTGEAGYVTKQESRLMSPAPFAPIRR